MKSIGFYTLMVISLAMVNRLNAQGGDNAAIAMGAPINLPFAAAGSTTGTTNNYDFLPAYWSIYTGGGDWLYYFCASSTDEVLISLGVTPPAVGRIFPSISVWQGGAPGIGTLTSVVDSDGSTGNVALSFNAVAGTCYYVMIDSYTGEVPSYDYTINLQYRPEPVLQPSCSNIGFDNATTDSWLTSYGYTVTEGAAGDPLPKFTPNVFNTPSTQHVIVNGGTDPLAPFPRVCNLIPGNTSSLRLGDESTSGNGGATIEQKFSVTTSNALYTYFYAVVVQDAGVDHPNTAQPFFKIEVLDCLGNPIQCGQYVVTGGPNIPGFFPISNPNPNNIYYSPWTSSFIDLTPYVGSCVTVRFTSADCSRGAHYGYAYIDGLCSSLPVITPDTICLGESAQVSSPILGSTYQWSVQGNPAVIGTGQTLNVSPVANTTYNCIVTNSSGCNTTLSFPFVVMPAVTVTVVNDTVCVGGTGTLVCNANPAGGAYQWSGGLGTQSSITVSPAVTTDYTCTYSLNGCTVSDIGTLVVNPLPLAPVTAPLVYCQNGTPASLTTSVTTLPGHTLNWYGTNAAGGVAFPTPPVINTSVATTLTYYVSQTNGLTGCEGPRAPINVTINPQPTIGVNSPSICAGLPVQLNASGANEYTWSTGGTGASVTVAPFIQTVYSVTGTNTATGCTATAFATVSILGTIELTINSPIICSGESAVLTVGGANDYVWSTTETGNSITVTPTTSSVYTVTGTLGGCVAQVTTVVTVNPVPVVTVNSSVICSGTTATLSAVPSILGGTYLWLGSNYVGSAIPVSPQVTSDFPVVYTINGCSDTATANVIVNPTPSVTVSPDTICVGAEATLVASTSNPGGNYSWIPGGNATSILAVSPVGEMEYVVGYTLNGCTSYDTAVAIVSPLPDIDAGTDIIVCSQEQVTLYAQGGVSYQWEAGIQNGQPFIPAATQMFTVTGWSNAGCMAQDSVLVTVAPIPLVSFIASDSIGCAPLDVTFTNLTAGGVDCFWTISNGFTSSGCGNLQYQFEETGCYDITLTVADQNGCVGSMQANNMVCVVSSPIASFSADPTLMPDYSTTSTMQNTSTNANSYLWNFEGAGTSTLVNPTITFPETAGAYEIMLIAYNVYGCVDTAYATVNVFEDLIYYVPNTFTPDDDEFNQTFQPVFTSGFDPFNFTMYIFDRWGELIFETHDATVGWDGTYAGKIVQDGTYVWKIDFQKKDDSGRKALIGHVNVLR